MEALLTFAIRVIHRPSDSRIPVRKDELYRLSGRQGSGYPTLSSSTSGIFCPQDKNGIGDLEMGSQD